MAYFKCKGEVVSILYNWDFTKSLTDEVQGQVATLNAYSEFQIGRGIIITPDTSVSYKGRGGITLYDNDYWLKNGITIEIDIPYANNTHTTGDWSYLLQVRTGNGFGFKHAPSAKKWGVCVNSNDYTSGSISSDPDIINNKTVKIELINDDLMKVYTGDEYDVYTLIYSGKSITADSSKSTIVIGSFNNADKGYNNFIVSGIRVYENVN